MDELVAVSELQDFLEDLRELRLLFAEGDWEDLAPGNGDPRGEPGFGMRAMSVVVFATVSEA